MVVAKLRSARHDGRSWAPQENSLATFCTFVATNAFWNSLYRATLIKTTQQNPAHSMDTTEGGTGKTLPPCSAAGRTLRPRYSTCLVTRPSRNSRADEFASHPSTSAFSYTCWIGFGRHVPPTLKVAKLLATSDICATMFRRTHQSTTAVSTPTNNAPPILTRTTTVNCRKSRQFSGLQEFCLSPAYKIHRHRRQSF